jgi:15-cis-phytoene synthase
MELYKRVTYQCSKLVTNRYSTSFSLGVRMFGPEIRPAIYGIYGFVRFADEIVDTFHGYEKASMLAKFRSDTFDAIDHKISLNPILNAFQDVVNTYNIDKELIESFLYSMSMDLRHEKFSPESYRLYIYGSAEVVGLMCLKVFCKNNPQLFNELKESACSLGSAFQKVNFLRDMKSDYEERGRTYFPGIDYDNFSKADKVRIEQEISADFELAFQGVLKLPKQARLGVYLAYIYYQALFKKIKQVPVFQIKIKRIRVTNEQKFALLIQSYLRNQMNIL